MTSDVTRSGAPEHIDQHVQTGPILADAMLTVAEQVLREQTVMHRNAYFCTLLIFADDCMDPKLPHAGVNAEYSPANHA